MTGWIAQMRALRSLEMLEKRAEAKRQLATPIPADEIVGPEACRTFMRIADAKIRQHREALERQSERDDVGPDGVWRLPSGLACSRRLGDVSKLY